MITLALKTGSARSEGYPVVLRGWEQYRFFVHNAERNGRVDETRWIVSEQRSGHAVTESSYPTDTEAIEAAQMFFDAKKTWWGAYLINRAIAKMEGA